MKQAELTQYLNEKIDLLSDEHRKDLIGFIRSNSIVFPFNKKMYVFTYLIHKNIISLGQYNEIIVQYLLDNKYLFLYEMGNTAFGSWGEDHLISLYSSGIYKSGIREHDLIARNEKKEVKIECKSSRALLESASKDMIGNIVCKAVEYSSGNFYLQFDHMKPYFCNVFVFIGVWIDQIKYWIIPSSDISIIPHSHKRDADGFHIRMDCSNIDFFNTYLVNKEDIFGAIMGLAEIIGSECDRPLTIWDV